MIKVLVVDAHQMMIDGIKAMLSFDDTIEVIGEALNGEDAIRLLESKEPDVITLDIEMPGMNGIETAKEIIKSRNKVKILIVTRHNNRDLITQLMKIGVSGYILKNKGQEELFMGIHNVYNNQPHFGLEVLTMVASRSEHTTPDTPLTDREKEILIYIAEGFTTKEIAEKLYISQPTVNTHRRNLLQKLGFPNDKHLVRYAIRKGFVKL